MMVEQYLKEEELALIKRLEININNAAKQCEISGALAQKAHAEKRAAEAELRAAQAEYNGQIMKLLWEYKLENKDSFRQSDGLIIIGKGNEDGKDDTDSKSEKD